jgi:hypothetical protein
MVSETMTIRHDCLISFFFSFLIFIDALPETSILDDAHVILSESECNFSYSSIGVLHAVVRVGMTLKALPSMLKLLFMIRGSRP